MTSPADSFSDPHAVYTERRDHRQAEADALARLDGMLGNVRLAVFLTGALAAWFSLARPLLSPWWLVVPILLFLAVVARHNEIRRRRQRAQRATSFYEAGLKRLEDRWAGSGVTTGARFSDPAHPYAEDLDLFGRGSLFEYLCTARTQAGEDCLAAWLRAPASPETIRARQAAVQELRPRLDLREDMALLGEEARAAVAAGIMAAWGSSSAPAPLTSVRLRIVAAMLAAATVIGLGAWAAGLGLLAFLVPLLVGQVFAAWLGGRVRQVVRAVEQPTRDLALFSLILARLENETFAAPLLRELRALLDTDGKPPPSARIARLRLLIELLESRNNQVFAPVAIVLLWATQFAFAIEAWRAHSGPQIAVWLRVVGEFEALCSLAGYAYEHPADPFPEIVEDGVCFEAEALAHPLLPAARSVANDLRLGDDQRRLFVVSGSNMSGKSTLLRTVGVNTVLALAGGPVRGHRLRLSPLSIGASLRTQDSLQGGISRFYAEITRLRQIVEIGNGQPPLLFLLDEILHGTNSHDRRVGAEAIIRALARRGAVGLVTTHDLALTRIADGPALSAVNVHFEDQLENGKMTFDYRLRAGVVEKSNAIELMRAVGLEV